MQPQLANNINFVWANPTIKGKYTSVQILLIKLFHTPEIRASPAKGYPTPYAMDKTSTSRSHIDFNSTIFKPTSGIVGIDALLIFKLTNLPQRV